jgi:hypothetical protein
MQLDLAMIWLKNYLCGIKQQSLAHKMMIDFYFWCLAPLSAISWRPATCGEDIPVAKIAHLIALNNNH